jgi:GNAT superfamily N-acetyltransferase
MGFLYFSLMKFEIREGIKTDLPAVLKLIQELAEYEKALDQVTISLEDLENDGFGERPWYWFLVAEKNHKVIGISFYFIRYSTWKGKFLYLEDFVVKTENRGQGIGAKLFEETIKVCHKLKVNGMVWQVLDWNTPAVNFYKKYNADISPEWLNGKLTKDQIEEINTLR